MVPRCLTKLLQPQDVSLALPFKVKVHVLGKMGMGGAPLFHQNRENAKAINAEVFGGL